MCPTWHYERKVTRPENLYESQLALRRAREAAAAGAAQIAADEAGTPMVAEARMAPEAFAS